MNKITGIVMKKTAKEGGSIGRLLVMEFADNENVVFDEIMCVIEKYSDFEKYEVQYRPDLSLPGLEIYPDRRKIYRDRQEVHLTAKEYDLLCLLVANKGKVITYEQIYEKVWGNFFSGEESSTIGFHICNLRGKLYIASPDTPFTIQCIREVGYRLEVNPINST